MLDGSLTVSELQLVGVAGTVVSLAPAPFARSGDGQADGAAAQPLITLRAGAPLLHLSHLEIRAPLLAEGGRLELYESALTATAPVGSSTAALTVRDTADVQVVRSRFEANPSGAVRLAGGELRIDACDFVHNHAERGGGMLVTNGSVIVQNSTFDLNSANVSGGALQVDGGAVVLAGQTLLRSSRAPVGSTIKFTAGSLQYRLPAPLGRYIVVSDEATHSEILQRNAAYDIDYPYACNAGFLGNSLQPSKQSSPQCNGFVRR